MFENKKIKELRKDVENQAVEIQRMAEGIRRAEETLKSPADLHSRVADLEVKMGKLWTMLTEVDIRGKEKLSKYGRRFGGMSHPR